MLRKPLQSCEQLRISPGSLLNPPPEMRVAAAGLRHRHGDAGLAANAADTDLDGESSPTPPRPEFGR